MSSANLYWVRNKQKYIRHQILLLYFLSEQTVTIQGYADLAALVLLTGYNLILKSMNPMAVQVIGCTMNKCYSTGFYGWFKLPESLCLNNMADILFRHISILSTIQKLHGNFINVPDQ